MAITFYTSDIHSYVCYLKVISMVDIDSKTNQSLENIIHDIRVLIDSQLTNDKYETTIDNMIEHFIYPIIFSFLKDLGILL